MRRTSWADGLEIIASIFEGWQNTGIREEAKTAGVLAEEVHIGLGKLEETVGWDGQIVKKREKSHKNNELNWHQKQVVICRLQPSWGSQVTFVTLRR